MFELSQLNSTRNDLNNLPTTMRRRDLTNAFAFILSIITKENYIVKLIRKSAVTVFNVECI